MNKKILLISSALLTLSLVTIFFFNNMDNKEKKIISNAEKDKQVINSNMITMMYETDAGTGIYEETKDNTWPESGYIFNDTLSGCENGGELEYNPENNTVNLLSNKSDRCYVYFDKYDGVWIDNVVTTNITGSSITLNVTATSENGSITKYYYSLNDSEEYQEVTSNVITINDLNKLTEYKISIYAIDNANAKSNIYEVSVGTTDISMPVINSVEVSNITDSGFTLTVNATSEVEIKKYYFTIDGDGEYNAGTSTTNIYTFTTLDEETSYDILIFVEDMNENYSEKYKISTKTIKIPTLADYIKSLYASQGSNNLYYHTSSLANSAGDNSYRYSGSNPNNYVCFGSDASICPVDNLYRIIGVFFDSEVKLIKSTIIGYYPWTSSGSNIWSNASLNKTLNNMYLNGLDSNWSNKISTHTWYVDGYSTSDVTPKEMYNYETSGSTYGAKIGLMYVNDYGYAATPENWKTTLFNYSNSTNNNWLYLGEDEWTISPILYYSEYAFFIDSGGDVYKYRDGWGAFKITQNYAVRPSFYLNSYVKYASGTGTKSDPFRIKIE